MLAKICLHAAVAHGNGGPLRTSGNLPNSGIAVAACYRRHSIHGTTSTRDTFHAGEETQKQLCSGFKQITIAAREQRASASAEFKTFMAQKGGFRGFEGGPAKPD